MLRRPFESALYTLIYDKVIAREVNPIDKKPFYHFHPASYVYSIATVGCNLRCFLCQNWTLSEWPKDHLPKRIEAGLKSAVEPVRPWLFVLDQMISGEPTTPEQLVDAALASGCQSMSYTFVEPTIPSHG